MTDESQALAQELVTATRAADKPIALLRKMFNGVTLPAMEELLDVEALRRHIEQSCVLVYAEVYSESEMRDALVFFSSSSGQAINAKLPLVEQRMEASLQAYMASVQRDLDG
jgi:hypothetical protein